MDLDDQEVGQITDQIGKIQDATRRLQITVARLEQTNKILRAQIREYGENLAEMSEQNRAIREKLIAAATRLAVLENQDQRPHRVKSSPRDQPVSAAPSLCEHQAAQISRSLAAAPSGSGTGPTSTAQSILDRFKKQGPENT